MSGFHFSFPRGAWERRLATLRVASCPRAGRAAERPEVRSHAERGNEKVGRIPTRKKDLYLSFRRYNGRILISDIGRSCPCPPIRIIRGFQPEHSWPCC